MNSQVLVFLMASLAFAAAAQAANYSWLGNAGGSSSDWPNGANWWNLDTGGTGVVPGNGDLAVLGHPGWAHVRPDVHPWPVITTVLYTPEAPLTYLGMDWYPEGEGLTEGNPTLTIVAGGGLEVSNTWMNHGGQETATIHITGGYLRSWNHLQMGMTAGCTSRIHIDSGFVYTPNLIFGPGTSNIDLNPGAYLYLGGNVTASVATWISQGKISGDGGALEVQAVYGTPIAGLTAVFAVAPVIDAPAIASLMPADNSTGIPVASNLVATFNKPITFTGTGSITLKNLSGGIDIPISLPGDVSISSSRLSINPPSNLVAGQEYAVEISADAIEDLADPVQAFAGLLESSTPNWTFTASAAGAHVKVFLLGGQSNAVGLGKTSGLPTSPVNLQQPQYDVLFYANYPTPELTTLRPGSGLDFGPELTFGRKIADASPAATYAIIKHAVGGTNLFDEWAPGSATNIYSNFRNTVAAGLAVLQAAGYNTEIVGMVWHQGESDAILNQQANYQTNLTNFIADIRSRYGANLRFLIGEIGTHYTPKLAELNTVIAAQQAVAATDPNAHFVPAQDLPFQDDLHFSTTGMITLGERFAAGYATLVPPSENFAEWISSPAFGIDPGRQGFGDDPDGDGLANGIEAWFGTHPGQFSQGLVPGAVSGNQFTFTHPQNKDPTDDLTGYYQWSPNLADWYAGNGVEGPPGGPTVTIGSVTHSGTSTVTATASDLMGTMFLRAGVLAN